MTISAHYRHHIIKSYDDVKKFITDFYGEYYLETEENDYLLCKPKNGEFYVSVRSKKERGDIFSPFIQLENPYKWIFALRKYINNQMMKD